MNEDANGIVVNDLLKNNLYGNSLSSSSVTTLNSNLNSINSNSLGSPLTTTTDGSISTSLGTISNSGWNSTTFYDGPLIYDDCSIRISDSFYNKEKIKEILDDIVNFCDNYCVLKCEGFCDGDSKAQCPLWNRLKCEKRV